MNDGKRFDPSDLIEWAIWGGLAVFVFVTLVKVAFS